jgi:hypothetical protein
MKITLNELRQLVKRIIKEETNKTPYYEVEYSYRNEESILNDTFFIYEKFTDSRDVFFEAEDILNDMFEGKMESKRPEIVSIYDLKNDEYLRKGVQIYGDDEEFIKFH